MRHTLLNNLADALRTGSVQFTIGRADVPPAEGMPAVPAVVLQMQAGQIGGQLAIRESDLQCDDPQKVIENMLADAITHLGQAVREMIAQQNSDPPIIVAKDMPPVPTHLRITK